MSLLLFSLPQSLVPFCLYFCQFGFKLLDMSLLCRFGDPDDLPIQLDVRFVVLVRYLTDEVISELLGLVLRKLVELALVDDCCSLLERLVHDVYQRRDCCLPLGSECPC